MNLVQRVERWGDTHHPLWLDFVRILLGAFLCYKGVDFLMNMGQMLNLITNRMSFGTFAAMLMSNYISFAHLLGGILLILGVLTRFACLVNIHSSRCCLFCKYDALPAIFRSVGFDPYPAAADPVPDRRQRQDADAHIQGRETIDQDSL